MSNQVILPNRIYSLIPQYTFTKLFTTKISNVFIPHTSKKNCGAYSFTNEKYSQIIMNPKYLNLNTAPVISTDYSFKKFDYKLSTFSSHMQLIADIEPNNLNSIILNETIFYTLNNAKNPDIYYKIQIRNSVNNENIVDWVNKYNYNYVLSDSAPDDIRALYIRFMKILDRKYL